VISESARRLSAKHDEAAARLTAMCEVADRAQPWPPDPAATDLPVRRPWLTDDDREFHAAARQQVTVLARALLRTLAMHIPRSRTIPGMPPRCRHDGTNWPCPTFRVIADALQDPGDNDEQRGP
jgi:hypothetical protein